MVKRMRARRAAGFAEAAVDTVEAEPEPAEPKETIMKTDDLNIFEQCRRVEGIRVFEVRMPLPIVLARNIQRLCGTGCISQRDGFSCQEPEIPVEGGRLCLRHTTFFPHLLGLLQTGWLEDEAKEFPKPVTAGTA